MPNIPYCERLIGRKGFSREHMVPPPSERGPHVVQFELTTGCSHGRCTFCNIYDGPNYKEKKIEIFKAHVHSVMNFVSNKTTIYRAFIGAGNALNVDIEKLIEASSHINEVFKKNGFDLIRLSVYGNTQDILKKGREGMEDFRRSGRSYPKKLVYWGLESGNSEVLKIAGKGYDSDQVARAGEILNRGNILNSTMVMPGLGGMSYFNKHVEDTARILNETRPDWITFMGLQIKPNTPYEIWMKKQEELNQNCNLTPYEVSEQTAQIIEKLNFPTIIGVHGYNIHEGFCINPVPIGSKRINNNDEARIVATELRNNMYKYLNKIN